MTRSATKKPKSGALRRNRLDTRGRFINSVTFSPSGEFLLGGGGLQRKASVIAVWDVKTLKLVSLKEYKNNPTVAIAASPKGDLVATTCHSDREVRLWAFPSLDSRSKLPLVESARGKGPQAKGTMALSLRFSPDEEMLAAGCWDLRARLWDLRTGELTCLQPAHRDNVDFIDFLEDGKTLVSGTAATLWVWDVKSHKVLRKFPLRGGQHLWKHQLSYDAAWLVSVGNLGAVRLCETASWSAEMRDTAKAGRIVRVAISADNSIFAAGYDEGLITVHRMPNLNLIASLKVGSVMSMSFAPKGGRFACATIPGYQESAVYLYESLI